jgi:hypothetical protein
LIVSLVINVASKPLILRAPLARQDVYIWLVMIDVLLSACISSWIAIRLTRSGPLRWLFAIGCFVVVGFFAFYWRYLIPPSSPIHHP